MPLQLIELKRNPLGAPVRQSRGIVPMKVKNDATSLNDKLRIANKVNNKYQEALAEKKKLLEDLELEKASLPYRENDNSPLISSNFSGKQPLPGLCFHNICCKLFMFKTPLKILFVTGRIFKLDDTQNI